MSINIVISDTVGINVKGNINNESGKPQAFDFSMVCRRLDTDAILEGFKSELSVVDFLVGVVQDWKGVKDEEGAAVPYDEAALRRLCRIPGVAQLAYRTYLADVGAKEKN